MIDYPKTIEEARKYRYAIQTLNPAGEPYREKYCAYEVMFGGSLHYYLQCSRMNGYGLSGLYCKQHAGMIIWQNYNA